MKKSFLLIILILPLYALAQHNNIPEDQTVIEKVLDPKNIKSVDDFKEFSLMPGEYEIQQLDLIVKFPNSSQLYTTTLWKGMDAALQERSLKHLWEAVPNSNVWVDNMKLVLPNGSKRTASISVKIEEDGMIYIRRGIED